MKTSKRLKALVLILVIVLIAILAFLGVYNITTIHGNNLVKDYSVGMELSGRRTIRLEVDDTVNDVTYDSEGNVVEEQGDEGEYTVVQEPVNQPEILTKENYKKSLEIIQDRLNYMEAEEYNLRFNEETGTIELEIIDNELTDYILETIRLQGNFKIIDSETEEVLMDRSYVKNAGVVYSSNDSTSTTVYLDIEFNKDGAKKLEELSKIYVSTTEQVVDEDGQTEEKTTDKKISVMIDDTSIVSTTFSEPLTNGHIYISVGQGTTNNEELRNYALQASINAALVQSDTVPVAYKVEQDNYVISNIDKNIIPTVALVVLVIEAIVLIIMFKGKGIVAAILQLGYVSLLLLIIRYTNVYMTVGGIFALAIAGIINVTYIYKILSTANKEKNMSKAINESLVKFINISIPILIVSIVFCFAKWLEINSFGMVMFWGYVVSLLYNIIFTKGILKNMFEK